MPYAPRRGCAYGNCKERAVPGSIYCEEHKRQMDSQYNKYERSADCHRRYGRKWQRIRDRYVKSHPYCEQCLKEGRITFVEEVHHIIPLSKGGTHDPENLMSLCQSCHMKIHMEMGDRQIRS